MNPLQEDTLTGTGVPLGSPRGLPMGRGPSSGLALSGRLSQLLASSSQPREVGQASAGTRGPGR